MHPWLHFKTITRHKLLVMKYCFRIGLYKQGLLHDLSKYSPTEFLVGCKYYQGTRSPNNAEREDIGVSTSWLHHKGRNKHHFEHWVDYSLDGEHPIMGAQMPRKYVAEMVMDRISASRNYLGDAYNDSQPLDYFLKSKEKLWFIHPQTKKELEALLLRLRFSLLLGSLGSRLCVGGRIRSRLLEKRAFRFFLFGLNGLHLAGGSRRLGFAGLLALRTGHRCLRSLCL